MIEKKVLIVIVTKLEKAGSKSPLPTNILDFFVREKK